VNFYDAHNHLQDDRFAGRQVSCWRRVTRPVSAGWSSTARCESDWPQVQALALENKIVLPSFGYHPCIWANARRTGKSSLEKFLDEGSKRGW